MISSFFAWENEDQPLDLGYPFFFTNSNLIPGEMQNKSSQVLSWPMAILTALWRISCESWHSLRRKARLPWEQMAPSSVDCCSADCIRSSRSWVLTLMSSSGGAAIAKALGKGHRGVDMAAMVAWLGGARCKQVSSTSAWNSLNHIWFHRCSETVLQLVYFWANWSQSHGFLGWCLNQSIWASLAASHFGFGPYEDMVYDMFPLLQAISKSVIASKGCVCFKPKCSDVVIQSVSNSITSICCFNVLF